MAENLFFFRVEKNWVSSFFLVVCWWLFYSHNNGHLMVIKCKFYHHHCFFALKFHRSVFFRFSGSALWYFISFRHFKYSADSVQIVCTFFFGSSNFISFQWWIRIVTDDDIQGRNRLNKHIIFAKSLHLFFFLWYGFGLFYHFIYDFYD